VNKAEAGINSIKEHIPETNIDNDDEINI